MPQCHTNQLDSTLSRNEKSENTTSLTKTNPIYYRHWNLETGTPNPRVRRRMTALVRRAVMKLSLQFQTPSSLSLSPSSLSISKTPTPPSLFSFRHPLSHSTHASKTTTSPPPSFEFQLFIPPGIEPDEVNDSTVLPGSNIAVGPYAGDSHIKDVQFVKSSARFVKSSARARDCPKDNRPEFAVLGRSNVGKSSLINSLVRKKEIALTSKKPG